MAKETTFGKVAAKGGVRAGGADINETELEMLDSITPGTVAVGKAIVPTTGKTVDELNITTLKKGGTAVTATAAELNKLAGAGAVVASGTAGAHVADLPAFTDPPTAAEMAALRTAVNSILAVQRAFGERASS